MAAVREDRDTEAGEGRRGADDSVKRSAMGHTKLKKLCRRLQLPLFSAVGLLECLWHLTAREAPRGDVGRLSDEDLALALEWDGEAESLVAAFVECGWMDRSPRYRLLIHDWHEHADEATKLFLKRHQWCFAALEPEQVATISDSVETSSVMSEQVATCIDSRAHALPVPLPEPMPMPEPEVPSASQRGERQKNGASPPGTSSGKDYRTKQALDIAVDHVTKRWSDHWREVVPNARAPAIQGTDKAAVREALKAISAADGCDYLAAERELTGYAERLAEIGKPLQQFRYGLNDFRGGVRPKANGRPAETPQEQRDRILRELADGDEARGT